MIVFLDFEASSLGKKSFPVEVAWVFEDGRSHSCLVRPVDDWTDWSAEAESLHGLSRPFLETEGIPVAMVGAQMLKELSGHQLYASAPSWDGKWLSVLLRAAGLPRHALRLKKSDEAFLDAARFAVGPDLPEVALAAFVARVIEKTDPTGIPAHRALPDAKLELHRWRIMATATARDILSQ
jgi:hypothetical protein